MSKMQAYKEKLKNLDPAEAIRTSQKYFSDSKFGEKLLKYAKKMGTKIVYYSLLLFYAFKSPDTPNSAKVTIAGALGYLILPIDIIPDVIPVVGFADDSAVIVYALYQVISHINEPVKQQADERMKKMFGESYDTQDIDDQFKPDEQVQSPSTEEE